MIEFDWIWIWHAQNFTEIDVDSLLREHLLLKTIWQITNLYPTFSKKVVAELFKTTNHVWFSEQFDFLFA